MSKVGIGFFNEFQIHHHRHPKLFTKHWLNPPPLRTSQSGEHQKKRYNENLHAFHLPPSATDLNPKSLSPPKQSKNLEKWSVADSGRRHDPIPYIRKTPRRNPRHLITLDQLTTTNWQVVDKMDQLGLCDELEEGEVYLVSTTSDAYCWYQGHIHIPAISEANLSDYFTGHQNRLTNELRHEWAYVLADAYPEWIKTRQFNSVFGGR